VYHVLLICMGQSTHEHLKKVFRYKINTYSLSVLANLKKLVKGYMSKAKSNRMAESTQIFDKQYRQMDSMAIELENIRFPKIIDNISDHDKSTFDDKHIGANEDEES
jgi:hypothetical protein